MESSIAEFLTRQPACELLPTYTENIRSNSNSNAALLFYQRECVSGAAGLGCPRQLK